MNKYLIGSHELCDSLFPGQYTANTFRFTILKKSSFFLSVPMQKKIRNYIWYKYEKKLSWICVIYLWKIFFHKKCL